METNLVLLDKLKQGFAGKLPGIEAQIKMAPVSRINGNYQKGMDLAVPSSVLILLFLRDNLWHTLFIQRALDGYAHSGQISFPGGRAEAQDKSPAHTALRETAEEIGINTANVKIIGQLTSLFIPVSNFRVHPFVGFWEKPDFDEFVPNPAEVASIEMVGLPQLFDPQNRGETVIDIRGFKIETPYYNVNGHVLWGATAMITSEFEELWKQIQENSVGD